ncbi:ABC transporter substrate-binding protein [Nostocaceae cyanobacterium CENA369]|uniref:ABC transporter substrate-binding protein n=1 Tax=Dendronalium phyllosphericum CENA369 TaxID=1725256 RepID=A0A8J7LLD9_9NOST|nr:ABC transporter substrate-binding protein [Dendronalium phyllosphericum]MBH8578314.1 ABC transporter substrate-binding protein [Dendronalium phyllosphericum CENA369]
MQKLKSVFPLGCLLVFLTACDVKSTNSATPNITNTQLRVAKYKGGWDLDLKLAGQDNFPYQVQFTEFTGGNLMVQSINAGAIDLASASEIPPIFAIKSQASVKIIATRKGPTIAQVVLIPKNSPAKSIADLKGKRVGYVQATTAHYFLIKMLAEVGLTMKDIKGVPLSIPDGLSAFRKGELDAWATYGYSIPLAEKDGARVLKSAKDILSGNFVIVAAPEAIANPQKKAAIADFLCRLQKTQTWQESHLKEWSKSYADNIKVDEAIVYQDAKQGQQQRPQKLLPISDEAIASQQLVADTFYQAGVISSKVDVKPLWDSSFNKDIAKCN